MGFYDQDWISRADVREATEDFSNTNVLGCGTEIILENPPRTLDLNDPAYANLESEPETVDAPRSSGSTHSTATGPEFNSWGNVSVSPK